MCGIPRDSKQVVRDSSSCRTPRLDDPAFDGFRLDPTEIRDGKEEIGKGTYGRVLKVKFRGSVRAAKEFHPNFTIRGKNNKEKTNTLKRFLRCTKLSHTNIVQLFGAYENNMVHSSIVLIMELMECSLTSLLQCGSEISNSSKLAILLDVSSGLKYMHNHNPPVVHYCMSSNNILLTAERRAKISDVGVAQLVVCTDKKKVLPKALPFMAPELQESNCDRGPSADVFSYGAVMLHTITQQQPTIVASSAKQTKQLQYNHKSLIDQLTDPFFHRLKKLAESCLYFDPSNRPQIALVSQTIKIMTEIPGVTKSLVTGHDHNHVEIKPPLQQVGGHSICSLKISMV